MLLGEWHDALDAFGAILESRFVVHASAVPGEGDDLRNVARFGGEGNAFLIGFVEGVVVFLAVEGVADAANSARSFEASHGAFEPVLGGRGPSIREKNLNGFDIHLFDFDTKLVERDFAEAPVTNGMLEAGIGASGFLGLCNLLTKGMNDRRGSGSESGE